MAKQKEKKEVKPVLLSAKEFSEMKGLNDLDKFVLEKKHPLRKLTSEDWSKILTKENLV